MFMSVCQLYIPDFLSFALQITLYAEPRAIRALPKSTQSGEAGRRPEWGQGRRNLSRRSVLSIDQTRCMIQNAITDIPHNFNPGSRIDYSTGIDHLGYIVEAISGLDLEE